MSQSGEGLGILARFGEVDTPLNLAENVLKQQFGAECHWGYTKVNSDNSATVDLDWDTEPWAGLPSTPGLPLWPSIDNVWR